jgi:Integrase core domain
LQVLSRSRGGVEDLIFDGRESPEGALTASTVVGPFDPGDDRDAEFVALRWMDRPTGRVIRRIHTDHCGELVHIDVKKLARIPDGGSHRKLGRVAGPSHIGGGYTHIHTAIDAYSRLAYSEFAGTENTANCVAFLERAVACRCRESIAAGRSVALTDGL